MTPVGTESQHEHKIQSGTSKTYIQYFRIVLNHSEPYSRNHTTILKVYQITGSPNLLHFLDTFIPPLNVSTSWLERHNTPLASIPYHGGAVGIWAFASHIWY